MRIYSQPDLAYEPDSYGYQAIAENIISGEAYSSPSDPSELKRPPGYPIFLAAIYQMVGNQPGNVIIIQGIISLLTGWLLFTLIREIASPSTAYTGLIIYLLDPLSLTLVLTLLTETIFTLFLTLSLFCIYRWHVTNNNYWLVSSGLTLGIATHIHPIGFALFLPILLMVYLRGSKVQWKTIISYPKVKPILIYASGYLILYLPWIVHNYDIWGCAIFSSIPRINLRDWMAAYVIADLNNISREAAWGLMSSNIIDACISNTQIYILIILQNPFIYFKYHLIGFLLTLFGMNFNGLLQLFDVKLLIPDLWMPFTQDGISRVLQIMFQELKKQLVGFMLLLASFGFQVLIYMFAGIGLRETFKPMIQNYVGGSIYYS